MTLEEDEEASIPSLDGKKEEENPSDCLIQPILLPNLRNSEHQLEIDKDNKGGQFDWKSRLLEFKPHGNLTEAILWLSLPPFLWLVLFLLLGSEALPKGTVFSLFVLQVGGLAFGNNNILYFLSTLIFYR